VLAGLAGDRQQVVAAEGVCDRLAERFRNNRFKLGNTLSSGEAWGWIACASTAQNSRNLAAHTD